MKSDYLWDKTGDEDAEIARLENALRAFRFQECDAARALPIVAAAATKIKPKSGIFASIRSFGKIFAPRFFSFKFASAAAALVILAVIAAALLIGVSSDKTKDFKAEIAKRREDVAATTASAAKDSAGLPFVNTASGEKIAAGKIVARKIAARRLSKTAPVGEKENRAPQIKRTPAQPRFTDEELYAYEQLRLALSIAGSKLKLVKDKVENAGETEVDKTTGAPADAR